MADDEDLKCGNIDEITIKQNCIILTHRLCKFIVQKIANKLTR